MARRSRLTLHAAALPLAALLMSGCAPSTTSSSIDAAAAVTPTPKATASAGNVSPSRTPMAAATETPAPPPSASNATQRLPGVPAASGPTSAGGRDVALPTELAALLLSLPADDVLATRELRQRALASGTAHLIDIPRAGGPADVLAMDRAGAGYRYWIRVFHGDTPGVTGYLLQMRVPCSALADATLREPATAARAACAANGAEYADSGLRAYRVVDGQHALDVTASLADSQSLLGEASSDRYAAMGASDVFVDDSRLATVPVIRWVVEFDPEQPLAATDPHAFDGGALAHLGFVVWSGDRFESRPTVPRTLWPCPDDKPAACPADDRFVTPGR